MHLYLYCLGQEFPTGCFVDGIAPEFKAKLSVKFMPMYFWMDHVARKENITIKHRMNNQNKEVYIAQYPVDGFFASTNTVYEFNGCYYHGHECKLTKHCNAKWRQRQQDLENRTIAKRQYLETQGYNVIEIRECEYKRDIEADIEPILDQYLSKYYRKMRGKRLTEKRIQRDICAKKLFGMVECDLEVPDKWLANDERKYIVNDQHPFTHELPPKKYFEQMSPIVCEIRYAHAQLC